MPAAGRPPRARAQRCAPLPRPRSLYGLWACWAGAICVAVLVAAAAFLCSRRRRAARRSWAAAGARGSSRLQPLPSTAPSVEAKCADLEAAAETSCNGGGGGGSSIEQWLEREAAAAAEMQARLAAMLAAVRGGAPPQ